MSVGVVLPRAAYDAMPRMASDALLDHAIRETPGVAGLMRAARREWPVRVEKDFSFGASTYAGDRWLLVGDAGSFLDPVFSTGVAIALESGVEAGRALDAALRSGDLSARAFSAFNRRQRRRYLSFRRFVVAFYTRGFRELFFAPVPPTRIFLALITSFAGYWRPSRRHAHLAGDLLPARVAAKSPPRRVETRGGGGRRRAGARGRTRPRQRRAVPIALHSHPPLSSCASRSLVAFAKSAGTPRRATAAPRACEARRSRGRRGPAPSPPRGSVNEPHGARRSVSRGEGPLAPPGALAAHSVTQDTSRVALPRPACARPRGLGSLARRPTPTTRVIRAGARRP